MRLFLRLEDKQKSCAIWVGYLLGAKGGASIYPTKKLFYALSLANDLENIHSEGNMFLSYKQSLNAVV